MNAKVRQQLRIRKCKLLRRISVQDGIWQSPMTSSGIVKTGTRGETSSDYLRRNCRDFAIGQQAGVAEGAQPPRASVQALHALRRNRSHSQHRFQPTCRRYLSSITSSIGATMKPTWFAVGAQRIPDPTTAGDFCRRITQTKLLQVI